MNNKKVIGIFAGAVILIAGIYFFGSDEAKPLADKSSIAAASETPSASGGKQAEGIDTKQKAPIDATPDQELKVDIQDCFAQFNNNQTPDLLLQHINDHIITFFRRLKAQGYRPSQQALIADAAGLNREDALTATHGKQVKKQNTEPHDVLLADNYDQQKSITSEQVSLFYDLIHKGDIAGITNAFRTKSIDPTGIHFGSSLVGAIIARKPDITVNQIQSLLAAGAEIHLETIVTAVKLASSEVVIFLAENYPKKLTGKWRRDDLSINLTMASAAAFRDDLFYYFKGKGIPPFIRKENSMLFDVMPEPVTEQQKQRALIYVVDALKHNARSLRLSSTERLKRWLPEDIQQTYQSLLTPSRELPADLMELSTRLRGELEQMQEQLAAAQVLTSACQRQHLYGAENYLTELLQGNLDSANLSLSTKNLIAKHHKDFQKKAWKKAAEEELKNNHPAELLNREELIQAHRKLLSQTMDKQWDEALALCSTHVRQDLRHQMCAQLLSSYVRDKNANWAFIEKILPHLNELNPNLLTPLVMHNKMDLLRKFAAQGLPFDRPGYDLDPLAWAMRMNNNTEAIAFLLEHGTPTKYDFPGPDALDVGLAQLDKFTPLLKNKDGSPLFTTPEGIALLVRAGAPIERSHIEKIQQLKTLNPIGYEALITAAPELAGY